MKIHEILTENVRKDYYTANIKAEVIFDTILTPVISGILTVIGQENKKLGINGEMKLLAKEFPMLKLNSTDYHNCNADYLMCDNDSVYFVELKTARESFNKRQMENYWNYLRDCKNEKFADVSGRAFIDLLNHVSRTGYSRNSDKPWGEKGKDDLKQLFETIIQYQEYKGYEKDWKENNHDHVERAIAYLKKEKAVSSKKYLLTAGQMLDHMKDSEWWDCKQIKVLYLISEMPSVSEMPSEEIRSKCQQEGIIFVTFQEIIEQTYEIGREMEKLDLKEYWEWVTKILIHCSLY